MLTGVHITRNAENMEDNSLLNMEVTSMKKYINASSNSNMLAVFWYVNGEFIGPEDTLRGDSVVAYGDNLQIDKDHFLEWDKYGDPLLEYDYYPRGRVLFNSKIHKFIVVADPKICNNASIREQLIDYYGLPISTIFETDEHYTSEA